MERTRISELLHQFGGSSIEPILDDTTLTFSCPDIDGLIGYRSLLNCSVVYGDPVCSPEDLAALTQAFHDYCKIQKKHIIYISTSQSFANWAITHTCKALITFGEELTYNPQNNPQEQKGGHSKLLRQKIHHAAKAGAKVQEYTEHNLDIENAIKEVALTWLKNRKGPQIHTAHIRIFEDRLGKRWFYATLGDSIVGLVVLNELKAKKGYALTNLMTTPSAPHGTSELLITTAFEIVAKEGCSFITSGSAPTQELSEIKGFNPLFSWVIKGVYLVSARIFHLSGHKKFWEKFCPKGEPTYLLFSNRGIGIRDAISLMRALNVSL